MRADETGSARRTELREDRGYYAGLRGVRHAGRRGMLAVAVVLAAYVALAGVGSALVIPAVESAGFPEARTPLSLLMIALMLPVVWGTQRLVFGVPGRWLHSVSGRFRARLARTAALVTVPAFGIVIGTDWLMDGAPAFAPIAPSSLLALLLGILVAPFQAAAEEYMFRGLIGRSVATWFHPAFVGTAMSMVVATILFASFHGTADPWRLAFYAVFGACASLMTWRSGGVEAAVVMHTVNNIAALVGMIGDGGAPGSSDQTGQGSPRLLVTMAACAVITGVVWWASTRAARRGTPSRAETTP
ncbi:MULTISPECIES: CPBP family intramembrane glutamic endopeptidase [Microbacterium]|uniref:CPBP family intramembrane glutamic endopeptidase n=1 Tax=Microbacterium TaxID=33882 RepID=UPI00300FCF15